MKIFLTLLLVFQTSSLFAYDSLSSKDLNSMQEVLTSFSLNDGIQMSAKDYEYGQPSPINDAVCTVKGQGNQTFTVWDQNWAWAKDRAMEKCKKKTKRCRLVGCRGPNYHGGKKI